MVKKCFSKHLLFSPVPVPWKKGNVGPLVGQVINLIVIKSNLQPQEDQVISQIGIHFL
jgi:hypothetical protein